MIIDKVATSKLRSKETVNDNLSVRGGGGTCSQTPPEIFHSIDVSYYPSPPTPLLPPSKSCILNLSYPCIKYVVSIGTTLVLLVLKPWQKLSSIVLTFKS